MKTAALLILTVGLPGAGKTREAKLWVDEQPQRRSRANRDMLRLMMHGGWSGEQDQEDQVTLMQHAGMRALLSAGNQVIVDDTNLSPMHREKLSAIALELAVPVQVWDFTGVALPVALARNEQRDGDDKLKPETIERMNARWLVAPRDRGFDPLRDVRHWVTRTFT
jgi:tRNA uridine 5-carbamoylmethylation protein Kti12